MGSLEAKYYGGLETDRMYNWPTNKEPLAIGGERIRIMEQYSSEGTGCSSSCICSTFLRKKSHSTCRRKRAASCARGRVRSDFVKIGTRVTVHTTLSDRARETWYHDNNCKKPDLADSSTVGRRSPATHPWTYFRLRITSAPSHRTLGRHRTGAVRRGSSSRGARFTWHPL